MPHCYAVKKILDHYPYLVPETLVPYLAEHTYVSLERKYLYVSIAKAGCTAVKSLIHSVEKLPPIDLSQSAFREVRRDMFVHDRSLFRMPSLMDLDDRLQEQILEDPTILRFTVVRNPYRRVISAWRDKVRLCAPGYEDLVVKIKGRLPGIDDPASLVTFPEFVQELTRQDLNACDTHWVRQKATLFYPALNLNYIGRVEAFGEAIGTFLRWVGRTDIGGTTKFNESVGAITIIAGLAQTIFDLYREDFALFQYEPDSWRDEAKIDQPGYVPESRYVSELVERNLLLGMLYKQRSDLGKQLKSRQSS